MTSKPVLSPKEINLLRELQLSPRIFVGAAQRLRLELFGYIRDLKSGVEVTKAGRARAWERPTPETEAVASPSTAADARRDRIGRRLQTGSRWLEGNYPSGLNGGHRLRARPD